MNIGIRLFFFDPFFQFLHLFFPFQHQFEILPVIIQIRFMTGIKFFNLHDLVFFLAVGMTDERLRDFAGFHFIYFSSHIAGNIRTGNAGFRSLGIGEQLTVSPGFLIGRELLGSFFESHFPIGDVLPDGIQTI